MQRVERPCYVLPVSSSEECIQPVPKRSIISNNNKNTNPFYFENCLMYSQCDTTEEAIALLQKALDIAKEG